MVKHDIAEHPARSRARMPSFPALAALVFLSACTTGSVMDLTPAVDVGSTTAAIPRVSAVAPVTAAQPLPVPSEPSAPAPENPSSDLAYPGTGSASLYEAQLAAIAAPTEPDGSGEPDADRPSLTPIPGDDPGSRSLAAEEKQTYGTSEQKIAVLTPPPPAVPTPAQHPSPPPVPPAKPEAAARPALVKPERAKPEQAKPERANPILAGLTRIPNPFRSSPPASPSGMPADEVACRRQLKRLGVTYTDIPRIGHGNSCGIAWPVKVTALSGNIKMRPAAKLNCEMAATFARWTKNELAPAARFRYLSGIKRINNGTYSCRRIAGSRTFSAHSKGNAIDIMSIDLENGRNLDVTKPGFFAFRQKGLLNTVRKDGCQYFTTVLGPGYNYDHRNHFHFDLMHRKSGHRACK